MIRAPCARCGTSVLNGAACNARHVDGSRAASRAALQQAKRPTAPDARSIRLCRAPRRDARRRRARRIAGSEHDRRPSTASQHAARVERHRPGARARADIRKREMPLATKDNLRLIKCLSACLGEAGKAIFADAYNGPTRGLVMVRALILGGTSDAHQLADALARARVDAIYSYGGRTRPAPPQPVPVRVGGFGGVKGLSDFIRDGEHHACDRRDASLCGRNQPQRDCRVQYDWDAADRTRARAVEQNSRRPLDGGRRYSSCVSALPEDAARVFLAIGRQHIAPFGAKPQHAYTLQFVDAPDGELCLARRRCDRGARTVRT